MIVGTFAKSGKTLKDIAKWCVSEIVTVRCEKCGQDRQLPMSAHTQNMNRTGFDYCKSCALTGIKKPNTKKGYSRPTLQGKNSASWKGGRYVDFHGYAKVYIGPKPAEVDKNNWHAYRLEHVLVIENHTGKMVTREEVVHHIDGDKLNNSVDNLVVMPKRAHHRIAHSSLQEIGYALVKSGLAMFNRDTNKYELAHRKLRELLGHPEEGNQQPSLDAANSVMEGSETSG